MTRTLLGLLLVGLALTACGCRMCASPYDYCGPMCDGCCGGTCELNQPRAGEISVMVEPQLLQPNLAEPWAVQDVTLSVEEPTFSVEEPTLTPTAPTPATRATAGGAPSSKPVWTAQRPGQSQAQ